MPFTHFLSLPLSHGTVEDSFRTFAVQAAALLKDAEGFHPSLLSVPQQLHVTLCMLSLHSEDSVKRVTAFLQEQQGAIHELLLKKSLKVQVKGLAAMNNSPGTAFQPPPLLPL